MRGLPGPGASLRGPFPFQSLASSSLGKGLSREAVSDGGLAAGEGTLGPEARHVGAPAPAQPACPAILAAQVRSRAPFCPGIEFHFQPLLGGSHGSLQTLDKEAKYTLELEEAWAASQSARAGLRGASPPRPRVRLDPDQFPVPDAPTLTPPPPPHTHTVGSPGPGHAALAGCGRPLAADGSEAEEGGPGGELQRGSVLVGDEGAPGRPGCPVAPGAGASGPSAASPAARPDVSRTHN